MYRWIVNRLRNAEAEHTKNGEDKLAVLCRDAASVVAELSERVEELEAAQEISPEAQHFVDTKADSIIDGLQDLLASVKERPRWIPVTERLPSPMRAVLVWTPYKHNVFMAYLKGNKWYVWGPDDICCHNWPEYHAITHWMSLPPNPEPPKEKT